MEYNKQKPDSKPVIVIAEHAEGNLRPVTFELIECARTLQQLGSDEVKVIILGDDISQLAVEIAETSGKDIIAIKVPGLDSYNSDVYKKVLVETLSALNSSYVCIAHTTQGMDFCSGLAIGLGASCISGVEGINKGESKPYFTRATHGGKILSDIRSNAKTTVLTIQPGVFKPSTIKPVPGNVETKTVSYSSKKIQNLEIKGARGDYSAITQADVIVAVGRGIQKEENLTLVHKLCDLFTRSAVGSSRPLCDMGWMAYKHQVGVTGATVEPKLYIACGISGASQHVAGINGAQFIVAVNTDPNAAIFNMADICIVEDISSFVPVLIEEFKKRRSIV